METENTKQPSREELIAWLTGGLRSGRLKAEATQDSEGAIVAVSVYLPGPTRKGEQFRDPRQTRPL